MLKKITPYLILMLSVSCFGVFAFLIYDLSNKIEEQASELITIKNKEVSQEISNYFKPLTEDIQRTVGMGKIGLFDSLDIQQFNLNFTPLLSNSEHISSIILANSKGDELMLLQLDSTYINRETQKASKEILPKITQCNFKNHTVLNKKTWIDSNKYDPRERPWYRIATENKNSINWTPPYQFKTTKEIGMTASYQWKSNNGETMTLAFDVLVSTLSDYINNISVSKNGEAFILTSDDRVLGFPKINPFNSEKEMKSNLLQPIAALGIPELVISNNTWETAGGGRKIFSFEVEGEKWWGSISEFKIGENTYKSGIIAPEYDFLDEIKQFKFVLFGSLSLVLFFTVIIALISRKIRLANALLKEKNEKIKSQKNEIEKQRDYALKQKMIAVTQKEIVQEKNKEITDSLTYATRIQKAIMPPNHDLKRYLKKGFILYQPKDIVAGDFYWLEHIKLKNKENKHVIFAVADCTGHGVPGAMVSVVCSNALNRSVREYHLTDPGKILDKTRMLVISEFQKSDDNIKDGMDIALCSLEQTNKDSILKYAGANNPLYIVRDNNQPSITSSISLIKTYPFEEYTLYEIKANKQPIGIYDVQEPFTTHTISLQKNDSFYLFSDGFVDQFGGGKGKKFKVKAFRELLVKVQHLPMDEQKTFIEAVFNKWKGKMDQIDDVCILGIKI